MNNLENTINKAFDNKETINQETQGEIREAVDLATGDDGFRSKEVIAILETNVKQNTEEYLKEKGE